MCRSISAAVNIIHDCDETFNYWSLCTTSCTNPGSRHGNTGGCSFLAAPMSSQSRDSLGILLRDVQLLGASALPPARIRVPDMGIQLLGASALPPARVRVPDMGIQVHSAFALRSYLYLFFHALIALPVTLFFGNGTVNAFYTVRLALAVPSAASEASLLVAVAAALHKATQAPSLPSFLPITSLPTFPTSVNAFYAVRLALAVLSAASEASLPVAANAFYTVRLALAVLSAASEASLLVAVATALHKATSAGSASSSSSGTREDKEKGKEEEKEKAKRERAVPAGIGERVGVCGLLLLCFCSGNFLASTTFLPSTFSMYAITWATSLTIQGRPAAAQRQQQQACCWGGPLQAWQPCRWCCSGMITGGFVKVVASGAITTVLVSVSGFEIIASGAAGVALCGPGSPAAGAARDDHWSLCEGGRVWCSHHSSRLSKWVPADRALSLCFDRLYYGPWTSSVFNLIRYNVFGGGDGPLSVFRSPVLRPVDLLCVQPNPLQTCLERGTALSLCCDCLYYGQWTFSILNLVHYNVLGGGDGAGSRSSSTLYGVEGRLFYLRNGLNNFTLALPLCAARSLSLSLLSPSLSHAGTLSVFRSPVDLLREREHRGGPLSLYYGQWTSSVLNLVRYNVFGGGDGAGRGARCMEWKAPSSIFEAPQKLRRFLRRLKRRCGEHAGLSLCFDRLYYGQWTSSVFNLIRYNVFGGGDGAGSTLYGVEGPLFYLRNGLNNFSLALPLGLILPLLLLIACFASSPFRRQGRGGNGGVERGGKGFVGWKEVVALLLLPVVIWVGFMSLQPHKEERFLYPIYALIPVTAAIAITIIPYLPPVIDPPASAFADPCSLRLFSTIHTP
ncbi:unnamed protein product [Closterium sp. NIES-65]|nr:unnamed protein product [Closterium sp. NIES-65]